MHAILYKADGATRLAVGETDPATVEGEVVASAEIGFDAEDVFAFLDGFPMGDAPLPTVEEVTNAFDPWLAWYGGSDRGCHAVLYGRKGEYDRNVRFRETDEGYEVSLQFGTVADVPENEFEPADVEPIVVTGESKLHAKRTFYDFCSVA